MAEFRKPTGKRRLAAMGAFSSTSSSKSSVVFSVPLEIVEEIFYNLPYHEVIRHCRLVCKQWKEVADSESLWRERCRRDGLLPLDVTPDNWRIYYVLCKKRRNLLKNPRAQENLQYWKIIKNGGDRWSIETPICPHPNPEVHENFVTSYGMCLKSQEINLKSEGYNSSFMDQYQPPIKITDWYASRCDCLYKIHVQLLSQDKKCIQKFEPKDIFIKETNNRQWFSMTHVFTIMVQE
ncbi:hypothetical protein WMY93_011570 [Mugilogobius chulae]|uniref:Uncharacterized protein n=1 Tax=Mugilogobius chulae TaxID=88201 RepID=A0AAW0PD03_9GOBI